MAAQKESKRFEVIDAPRPRFKTINPTRETYATMLNSLREDQCIECENISTGYLYTMAKYLGITIQTQKQLNGKLRVWKIATIPKR